MRWENVWASVHQFHVHNSAFDLRLLLTESVWKKEENNHQIWKIAIYG